MARIHFKHPFILQAQGEGIELKTANNKRIHSFIDHLQNGLFLASRSSKQVMKRS